MRQGQESANLTAPCSGRGKGAHESRARHSPPSRHHLGEAAACLGRYPGVARELELGCEELRGAARALGRVTGAIDTEQVLDSIFSEFCIGK